MARQKKFRVSDFPEAGTVFAMPLEDGRIGICRVIRKEIKSIPCALVAASDWISTEPPALSHPSVRKILIKNHHNWKNAQEILWVTSPPPQNFKALGRLDSVSQDAKLDSNSYGGWESCAIQVLSQWQWDNEREKVLAEDETKHQLELTKRKEAAQKRAEYLATITLEELAAKDLFPTWADYPPGRIKAACQKTLKSLIQSLDTDKKPLEQKFVESEFKKCVEELNKLDSQNKNFIETVEREDLCEVLEQIASAAKFPGLIEKIEGWRNW